ncbi:MAG: recombinase family protein [Bacillaceae bacterium]|nr:recombinase family protein [Bacillaceae bacterium]
MEMARTTLTEEEMKDKEEAYRAFEEHIESVEDGRPYRTSTIQWLDTISNMEAFYEQITLEHFRAWILNVSVTSEQDYEVKWLDGMVTTIGSPLKKEIDSSPTSEEKQTTKEVTSELKILNDKGELIKPDKEKRKASLPKREVQKIEPNNSKVILQTIEAKMEGVNKLPTSHLNIKDPLRTAAYCRVSTDRLEQQSSLKTQVAYYTYLILKNQNYQFAGIYADEGISGRSMKKRDELNRLIQECERGRIDVVLVKSISRLSRDIQDTLEITRYLRQLPNPTYIYFERENIWTSDLKRISCYPFSEALHKRKALAWGGLWLGEFGAWPSVGLSIGKDRTMVIPLTIRTVGMW